MITYHDLEYIIKNIYFSFFRCLLFYSAYEKIMIKIFSIFQKEMIKSKIIIEIIKISCT